MSSYQDRIRAPRVKPLVQVETAPAGYSRDTDFGVIPEHDIFFKAAHAAKLFCIASALLIPNILFLTVIF